MSSIISVENISKRYILKHQNSERYTALRDVIANKVKGVFGWKPEAGNRKSTEEFWALKDVSFEVKQGDKVGIIGRNGAGKSTLLKILSRIVDPTKGMAIIDGRVASLLEVGTGFHPELTGRENIFLNGSILGMSKQEIKNKFDEIVAFAEVERFLDTPVKRYSSGMYVRLAFAVAAHLEPEILIIDEVLAVGDAQFQKKCLGKMSAVANEGRTILFVSHNMEAIQKLCTKGILLDMGKLIVAGNIDHVVGKYLDQKTSSSSVFQIPIPADSENIPGYVLQVQVEDLEGKSANEILMGAGWAVRVKFIINKQIEGLVVGMGIVTIMDFPVRTTWSKQESFREGVYEALFIYDDIMLTSGNYKIIIGLSQQHITFNYVDNIVNVTISEVSNLVNDERIINSKSGLLLNQAKVRISQV